ncbi:MAG TPA: hypothetical protein VIA18_01925, partial [Polyangia bacterium]|nr:hypothetical protein [Polyangia bacterium]
SPDRQVTNGTLRPIDGLTGDTNDGNKVPFPTVNSGRYSAHTQIFSLAVTINWDETLRKKRRANRYAD